MGARTQQRPVQVRRWTIVGLYAALSALLVPGMDAGAGDWSHAVLLCSLAALAVTAAFSAVDLPSGARWDADTAVALIALVLAGPLPAFAVWLAPNIARILVVPDERRFRFGHVANLVGTGWPLLAAWGVLQLAGAHHASLASLPAIVIAGVVLNLTNQAIGPMMFFPLWCDVSPRLVIADLRRNLMSDVAMVVLGALTVTLMARLGYAALITFSIIVVIPRVTVALLARARSVTRLAPAAATAMYTQALGSALGMTREDRKTLLAVLGVAEQHEARLTHHDAQPWAHTKLLLKRFSEVMSAAWMTSEWWDGSGPANVCGEDIPLAARLVSVAQAWSALTASGGPQLSHEEALERLRAQAGTRLDPAIVDTMAEVIELERCLTALPACEPRVYRLPVPSHWREGFALRVGGLGASGA